MSLTRLPFLRIFPLRPRHLDLEILNLLSHACLFESLLAQEDWACSIDLNTQNLLPNQAEGLRRLQRLWDNGGKWALGFPLLTWQEHAGSNFQAPLAYWPIHVVFLGNYRYQINVYAQEVQANSALHAHLQERLWQVFPPFDPKQPLLHYAQTLGAVHADFAHFRSLDKLPAARKQMELHRAGVLGPWSELEILLNQNTHTSVWTSPLAARSFQADEAALFGQFFAGKNLQIETISIEEKIKLVSVLLPALLIDGASILVLSQQTSTWQEALRGLDSVGCLHLNQPSQDEERLETQWKKLKAQKPGPALSKTYVQQFHDFQVLHRAFQNGQNRSQGLWARHLEAFLQAQGQAGRHLLGRSLRASDFDFSEDQAAKYEAALHQQAKLFQALESEPNALEQLQKHCFSEENAEQAQTEILEKFEQLAQELDAVCEAHLAFFDAFSAFLWWEYRRYAADLEQGLLDLLERLRLNRRLYGSEAFDDLGSWNRLRERVFGIFSGDLQRSRSARQALAQDYQALRHRFQEKAYFQTQLPDFQEFESLKSWEQVLEQARVDLQRWQSEIPQGVARRLDDLHSNYPVHANFRRRMEQLDKQLKDWRNAWILADLWPLQQELNEVLLSKRLQILMQLRVQFGRMGRALKQPNFLNFYRWRRDYLGQTPAMQAVVQACRNLDLSPNLWVTAFAAWYRAAALAQTYRDELPRRNFDWEAYLKASANLRTTLRVQAEAQSRLRLGQALPFLPELPKSKAFETLWTQWTAEQMRACFPIFLAEPKRFEALWTQRPMPPFEVLILDTWDALSENELQRYLLLGKQVLVLGTKSVTGFSRYALELGQWKTQEIDNQEIEADKLADSLLFYLGESLEAWGLSLEIGAMVLGRKVDLVFRKSGFSPLIVLFDGGLLRGGQGDYEALGQWRLEVAQLDWLLRDEWTLSWWQQPEQAKQALLQVLKGHFFGG